MRVTADPSPDRGPRGIDCQAARACCRLSRRDFAQVLHVHYATVWRWERKGANPAEIDGMPRAVVVALNGRSEEAAWIGDVLTVKGPLVALGMLIKWATA